MASGTKDFWITAETDIVAQTIAKMNVDVVAQSLDKLAVDISSQTLSKLDIDIVSQALTNLSIDINKQSLGQIMQRPKYGAPQQDENSGWKEIGDKITIHSFSGQGKMYSFYILISSSQSFNDMGLLIEVDGQKLTNISGGGLYDTGLVQPGDYIIHCPWYSLPDHKCIIASCQDITFESSLVIRADTTDCLNSVYTSSHALVGIV